jgi:hypothetical protein
MSLLIQELHRIESHFMLARIEYLHLFSPEGHLLHQLRGTKKEVSIPSHINLRGTVLTHNHPNDSDLSAKDCYTLLKNGIAEIRAYGRSGVYRLINPHDPQEVSLKVINKLFHVNALKAHGINGARLVAQVYGLTYEFVPHPHSLVDRLRPMRQAPARAAARR